MSSIASVQSTNSALLSDIKSFQTGQTKSGTPQTQSRSRTADYIDLSQVGLLVKQLQQLETSNPTEFKQALTDAAAKFGAAASNQADPVRVQFLQDLSGKFQQAADSGSLAALQPPTSAGGATGTSRGYAAHGQPQSLIDGAFASSQNHTHHLLASFLAHNGTTSG